MTDLPPHWTGQEGAYNNEVMKLAEKLTRLALLGALLVTVAPGPVLAFCDSDLAAGCCCSPQGCPTKSAIENADYRGSAQHLI